MDAGLNVAGCGSRILDFMSAVLMGCRGGYLLGFGLTC